MFNFKKSLYFFILATNVDMRNCFNKEILQGQFTLLIKKSFIYYEENSPLACERPHSVAPLYKQNLNILYQIVCFFPRSHYLFWDPILPNLTKLKKKFFSSKSRLTPLMVKRFDFKFGILITFS